MGFEAITTNEKGVKIKRQEQSYNGGSFATYSVMVYTKETNGDFTVGYIPCQFKKGTDLADKTRIKINNAFYTCNKSNNRVFVKLFINDYEVLESGDGVKTDANGFIDVPDDADGELPFV